MARRFVFSLQTLLRVRTVREREAQRRLAARQAEIAQLDAADREAFAAIRAEQQSLLALQQGVTRALDLARGRAWIAQLQSQIAQRARMREELSMALAQIRQELLEARKQTRMLEKLRERRFADYVAEHQRHGRQSDEEVARRVHRMRVIEADGMDGAVQEA